MLGKVLMLGIGVNLSGYGMIVAAEWASKHEHRYAYTMVLFGGCLAAGADIVRGLRKGEAQSDEPTSKTETGNDKTSTAGDGTETELKPEKSNGPTMTDEKKSV